MRENDRPMTAIVMGFLYLLTGCLGCCLMSGCAKSSYASYEEVAEESEADSVETSVSSTPESKVQSAEEKTKEAPLVVYVCGAVNSPGVYELPQGARVYQAIQAAGGFCDDADQKALNQASLLTDGDQITVYTVQEVEAGQMTPAASPAQANSPNAAQTQKININTADQTALQSLKGIGASRAQDIIDYREANGPFQTIEDIMKVSGIKQSLFDKIKEDITVGS